MTTDTVDLRAQQQPMPCDNSPQEAYRSTLQWMASGLSPRRISGVYLLIALIVFFTFTTSSFFTVTTLKSVGTEQAITAIAAIGLTVALAAGVFDLSISGVIGLANILVAEFMVSFGLSPAVAIILTLIVGAFVGVVNGILVTRIKIDPFIATLGTQSVLTGLVLFFSHNQNVLGIQANFVNLAAGQAFGIPLPVIYMLALGLVIWYVMQWTPVGRRLYATGGSREVARLAGVPTNPYIMGSFVLSATIASAAGILVVATVGTGSTQVGPSYLLPAFAAGFLGATQFRPGRFNIWGTVLAVYLLATGAKGLTLLGAATWVPPVFDGLALIVAVGISGFQRRARVKETGATNSRWRPFSSSKSPKLDPVEASHKGQNGYHQVPE
jgi:ribose transport system permease protein